MPDLYQDDNEDGDVSPSDPDETGSGSILGYITILYKNLFNFFVLTQAVKSLRHLDAYPTTALFLNTKNADYVLVPLQNLHVQQCVKINNNDNYFFLCCWNSCCIPCIYICPYFIKLECRYVANNGGVLQ